LEEQLIRIFILFFLVISYFSSAFAIDRPSKSHEIFFQGTDYELNIYRIFGRNDGKTVLIIGGIQGDEPGGFLAADLYSDLTLEKGNLIVVPRANFKSIILFDRGPDGDMNRRFKDSSNNDEMGKVVEEIKELFDEADVFLHLHDGWGYHYPVYVDELRNPYRFGQSIIVDMDKYVCDNGKELNLKEIAEDVLREVNGKINNKDHYLHYFNTDSKNPSTKFKEMQKTATFYAVTQKCIPAFGIESSKNLPSLEQKILYHNYAVNAFLKYFNVIPEQPQIITVSPAFYYAVIDTNNKQVIVKNNDIVYVDKGSSIKVSHIESNYQRGLSCDVERFNGLNDLNVPFTINEDKEIIFRKDSVVIGKAILKVAEKPLKPNYYAFIVEINNKKTSVLDGETIYMKKGDTLKLVKVFSDAENYKDIKINFKGYVPEGISYNDGDDRMYEIKIDGAFMKKYSLRIDKEIYPVVAVDGGRTVASFNVEIVK
jgi:hypothetical protein